MRLRATLVGLLLACPLPACWGGPAPGARHPELVTAAEKHDALALSDALEGLIAEGRDTPADREYAYQQVSAREEPTVEYAFARAAVTGRYIQTQGVTAAQLVGEVETWARKSKELDPNFRGAIATRMLGTLYVLAPGTLLQHGDSEEGLSLLEGLVKAHPEVLENRLRLAEALIALGDPAPAVPHLCACLAAKARLRHDDQLLLAHLVKDSEMPACPGASAPPP